MMHVRFSASHDRGISSINGSRTVRWARGLFVVDAQPGRKAHATKNWDQGGQSMQYAVEGHGEIVRKAAERADLKRYFRVKRTKYWAEKKGSTTPLVPTQSSKSAQSWSKLAERKTRSPKRWPQHFPHSQMSRQTRTSLPRAFVGGTSKRRTAKIGPISQIVGRTRPASADVDQARPIWTKFCRHPANPGQIWLSDD